jgi:DNA topoisomerase I
VKVDGSTLRFHFRGKGGKEHRVSVEHRRVARIVRACQDLPGHELFQYEDDEGNLVPIDSADVNEYVRTVMGDEFTAKDFRTWSGTVLARLALVGLPVFRTQREAKKNVVRAIEDVARQLGNTPAICKKCYVHPAVLEAYLEGALEAPALSKRPRGLRDEEVAALALLEARARIAARAARKAA